MIREIFSMVKGWARLLVRVSYGMTAAALAFTIYLTQSSLQNPSPQHFVKNRALVEIASSEPTVVEVESRLNHLVLATAKPQKGTVYVLDRVNYEPNQNGPYVLEF